MSARKVARAVALALCAALVCHAVAVSAGIRLDGRVALKGGRVVLGDGQSVDGGVVVFEGGKITAVGKDAPIPAGFTVLDVTGKVVTPGFIDAYTHLGLAEVDLESATVDADPGGDSIRAAFRASDAINPDSLVIPIQRAGGVTLALVAPSGGLVGGQSAWLRLGGLAGSYGEVVQGPSAAMHMTFGAPAAGMTGGSRGGALLAMRELFADARFYRKNAKGFDENRSRALSASRLDLEALFPVMDGRLPVMARAQRASDIRAVLALASAEGFRPIIVGGAEAWRVADALAGAKVPVVVEGLENLPDTFESLGARADNAALLHRAGVPVVLASFDNHNVRNLRQKAGNAVRGGLPWDAAIVAVTLAPAAALGIDAEVGALSVGRRADVVVWSGDPFELSTRVEEMFIGGAPVSLDNRQRQLMERYRELPRRGEALGSPDSP